MSRFLLVLNSVFALSAFLVFVLAVGKQTDKFFKKSDKVEMTTEISVEVLRCNIFILSATLVYLLAAFYWTARY